MTAERPDEKPQNEQRLMALLALSAQEPAAHMAPPHERVLELDPDRLDPAGQEMLYRHLDADPEAFEEFLRQHRHTAATAPGSPAVPAGRGKERAWRWLQQLVSLRPARYALAFTAAAVCSLLAFHAFLVGTPRLAPDIDAAYAALTDYVGPAAAAELALPRDDREMQLGFGPRAADVSPRAQAFAAGADAGRHILMARDSSAAAATPSDASDRVYYELGQWNILLWAAARSERSLPADFWQAQRERHQRFIEAMAPIADRDQLVATHLQRVDALLDELSQQHRTARSARALAGELQLFRAQFAPAARAP